MLADRVVERLARGRAMAEARMLSRVAVMRKTGDMTTGPDGFEVPEWATVHVDLPFRLGGSKQGSSGYRTVTVGGVEMTVATREGSCPADTTGLQHEDLADITAGENAGKVYQLVEPEGQDQATALRVAVVEVKRPEEWG